jgi:hypothetical protein
MRERGDLATVLAGDAGATESVATCICGLRRQYAIELLPSSAARAPGRFPT